MSLVDPTRTVHRSKVKETLAGVFQEAFKTGGTLGDFLSFFEKNAPDPNYIYGKHTYELIRECEKTTLMLEAGKSRNVIVNIPFRHGKSDVVSRRFPVWHLARNPDHEVILASYNHQFATDLSFDARACFEATSGTHGFTTARDRRAVSAWRVSRHKGAMYSAGLGGTIVGRGANVLIIDDYYKNREEAESIAHRDKVWTSFRQDMLTRRAPISGVFIVAQRWNEDDLVGRILNCNDPDHEDYDADFPHFDLIKFPAIDDDGDWLFPERFPEEWYKSMMASLGGENGYGWMSMGQQSPKARIGNMLRADLVTYVDSMPPDLPWQRGWDLASSEKERFGDDPAHTVGTRACYHDGSIYVDDVVRMQCTAGKRNALIERIALEDGTTVRVFLEVVAGYKDAFDLVREALAPAGIMVEKYIPTTDKIARAALVEPTFELGRVHVRKAPWNAAWEREFLSFPGGKKKDQVDSLVIAVYNQVARQVGMSMSF